MVCARSGAVPWKICTRICTLSCWTSAPPSLAACRIPLCAALDRCRRGQPGHPRQARLWTAPGRVVPRIHRRDGTAGGVRVQLSAAAPQPALHWRCGDAGGTLALAPASVCRVRITGLTVQDTQQSLLLALDGSRRRLCPGPPHPGRLGGSACRGRTERHRRLGNAGSSPTH